MSATAPLHRIRNLASLAITQIRGGSGKTLKNARRYVGTRAVSGEIQFDFLKRQGCQPSSKVLEIGCGCLNAGILIIDYLDPGNYVGIDPNEWLREAAMKQRRVRKLVEEKQPRFLTRDDFDAGSLGVKFDYVFSHSILSHAAHRQLEQFLRNAGAVLAPKGRILSSIRLAEGNPYGSPGTPDRKDSMDEEWQYPGVSWFTLDTVKETADKLGLTVTVIPEYTAIYTKKRKSECHDWVVFARKI